MKVRSAYINFIQNVYLPDAGYLDNLREPFRNAFKQGTHIEDLPKAFIKNWGQIRFDKNLFELVLELPMKSLTGDLCSTDVRKIVWAQYKFIPCIVDVPKKITIRKDEAYKKSLLSKGDASRLITLHLHIYRHGMLSILLNLSLHFDPPLTTDTFISVINQLRPKIRQGSETIKTRTASVNLTIPPHFTGTSTELCEKIAEDTIDSLVGNTSKATMVAPECYTVIHSPDLRSDRDAGSIPPQELYGLLKMNPNFKRFKAGYVSSCSSVFGKYERDIIIPDTKAMIIGLPRTHNVYEFHWNLVTIAEFVLIQKQLFEAYINNLRRSRNEILKSGFQPSERVKSFFRLTMIDFKTVDFLEELLYFHREFSPQYRRWYYILTERLGVDKRKAELLRELDSYIREGRDWQPPVRDFLNLLGGVKGLLA